VAQLVVRNIEDDVKARLRRRAVRHRRSLEEEVREILRNAAKDEDRIAGGLGSEIAALFGERGLDQDIPELRGYDIAPPDFDP